jgi:hypothetical protein
LCENPDTVSTTVPLKKLVPSFLKLLAPEKFEIKFRFSFSYQLAERDYSQAFIFTAKRKDKPFRGSQEERELIKKTTLFPLVSLILHPPSAKAGRILPLRQREERLKEKL